MNNPQKEEQAGSPWLKAVMIVAALYHLVAGTWIFLFPTSFFSYAAMGNPEPLALWRLFGLVFYVFGLGYALAGINPSRFWPVALMGLVWNMLVPLSLGRSLIEGADAFSNVGAFVMLLNHLIWWVPFAAVLYCTAKMRFQSSHSYRYREAMKLRTAMEVYSTSKGVGVFDATREQPLLLVFLGQFGASWTKRTLRDLSEQQDRIESQGILPVIVHMASPNEGRRRFVRSKLSDVAAVSDPSCELYRAFELEKATRMVQQPGPKLWWQVLKSAVLQGVGLRGRTGDLWQMPGVFLVSHGQILWAHRYAKLSERVDLMGLVIRNGESKPASQKKAVGSIVAA